MREFWRDIPGFEQEYQASSFGRMRSLDRYVNTKINNNEKVLKKGKILIPHKNIHGYYRINLKQKKYSVHRLVAETFLENPNNYPCVNHKDGNKLNNNVDNLEWCTRSANTKHAYKLGLLKKRFNEEHWKSRKIIQCDLKGHIIKEWHSIKMASESVGIATTGIGDCCRGKRKTAGGYTWKYKE